MDRETKEGTKGTKGTKGTNLDYYSITQLLNYSMNTTHNKGKKAEDIAAELLIGKGYTILHRNWRYFHKEIDIVAMKDNTLVVVEVKSRYGLYGEPPAESVTTGKQKHIVDAAEAYIFRYDIHAETRFDIIAVTFSRDEYFAEHIEDAYVPGVNW